MCPPPCRRPTIVLHVAPRRQRREALCAPNRTLSARNMLPFREAGATVTVSVPIPAAREEGEMYLFTRSGRFAPGSTRDAVAYVGEVTEKVRQETGLRVDAWSSTFSPDLGTVVWAVFVEDLAVLEQANDKLTTSDSYLDLIDRGAQLFAGPASDSLAQVVVGEVDPAAPTPQYV